MFFKKKPSPVDRLREKARKEQERTDEAYERLLEALRPSDHLQETINKAVGK